MPVKKNIIRKRTNEEFGATVSNSVKNYSNDPVFVKKANSVKALIKQYGLPKSASVKN